MTDYKGKRNSQGNLITENFKRPDHPDFKDFYELKKEEFSGIRKNSISQEWEIWLEGQIKAHGDERDIDAFAAAYQEVFGCSNVAIIGE